MGDVDQVKGGCVDDDNDDDNDDDKRSLEAAALLFAKGSRFAALRSVVVDELLVSRSVRSTDQGKCRSDVDAGEGEADAEADAEADRQRSCS
jgi:hypothetical protein